MRLWAAVKALPKVVSLIVQVLALQAQVPSVLPWAQELALWVVPQLSRVEAQAPVVALLLLPVNLTHLISLLQVVEVKVLCQYRSCRSLRLRPPQMRISMAAQSVLSALAQVSYLVEPFL